MIAYICDFCNKQAPQTWSICCYGGYNICFICSIRNPEFNERMVCNVCHRELGYYMYNTLKVEIEDHYRANSYPVPPRQSINRNIPNRTHYQQYPKFPPQYPSPYYPYNTYTPHPSSFDHRQFNEYPYQQKILNNNQFQQVNYQKKTRMTKMDIESNIDVEGMGNFIKNQPMDKSTYMRQNQHFEEVDIERKVCQKLRAQNIYQQQIQNQNPYQPTPQLKNENRDDSPHFSFGDNHNSKTNQRTLTPERLYRSKSSINVNPLFQKSYVIPNSENQ